MKDRHKKMLRLLLNHKGLLHLEELAETFSIGKRTVSRDLDSLDHWLSLKGARLERTPGRGIQVHTFGSTADDLLNLISKPDSYIESMDPGVRQSLIILYLLYHDREIKISDIANSFFISDTSVWNDLNLIESDLTRPSLSLERHKGVGIQLKGDESHIRLEFLNIVTNLVSSKTVVPYLYQLSGENPPSLEMNQLHLFLEKLNFPENKGLVLEYLNETADTLGYQFTMSGVALLYFYLQLTVHRIKDGSLIHESYSAPGKYYTPAEKLLNNMISRVFSGVLPRGEISFLALFLSVMEIGTGGSSDLNLHITGDDPVLDRFTEELVSSMGRIDKRMYYLNERIEAVLHRAVASLITRYEIGIPFWRGDWGEENRENSEAKRELLDGLLQKYFNLKADKNDLNYILIYLRSLFLEDEEASKRKIRCLVCCFEGIGLASYLQTVLKREIDTIEIVESTAVFKIRQEYLNEKQIELVISTFPISGLTSPLIPISLPLDKVSLIKQISEKVTSMTPALKKEKRDAKETERQEEYDLIFDETLDFISHFNLFRLNYSININEIIDQLSQKIAGERVGMSRDLARSFLEREELGALFFEEYGVRVLHCKSKALKDPRAGVIHWGEGSRERMLYMIAPDPCPERIRKMLSTVTISFMENFSFRESLVRGKLQDIRRSLMDIYREKI